MNCVFWHKQFIRFFDLLSNKIKRQKRKKDTDKRKDERKKKNRIVKDI